MSSVVSSPVRSRSQRPSVVAPARYRGCSLKWLVFSSWNVGHDNSNIGPVPHCPACLYHFHACCEYNQTESALSADSIQAEKHKGTFLAPVGIGLSLFIAELAGKFMVFSTLKYSKLTFTRCLLHWRLTEPSSQLWTLRRQP